MDSPLNSSPLCAKEIHGFDTLADLDIQRLLNEAQSRWFRPNEVHAILTNYNHFKIQPQPIDRPKSGTILLFDRKVLRNFRKDGYNWRKKKDGKNVQEAHEKLKIGNEERIHVYYARSDDDPNFYRRSYWLLDKNLERIVLVHYRQTSEDSALPHAPLAAECVDPIPYNNLINNNSPPRPLDSTSGSAHSELSGTPVFSEEINSGEDTFYTAGSGFYPVNQHAQIENISLDDLGLDELVKSRVYIDLGSHEKVNLSFSGQQVQNEPQNYPHNASFLSSPDPSSSDQTVEVINNNSFDVAKQASNDKSLKEQNEPFSLLDNSTNLKPSLINSNETLKLIANRSLINQDSFGQWNFMNYEDLGALDCEPFDALNQNGNKLDELNKATDISNMQEPIFSIVDISPEWAYSTIETKVIIVGYFNEPYKHLSSSKLYCVFGEECIATEKIQDGAYRFITSPFISGTVNFFLSIDGRTPISQLLGFEHRSIPDLESKGTEKLKKTFDQTQIRLAHLLFSTTKVTSTLSSKIQPKFLKEAKKFESLAFPLMEKEGTSLLKVNNYENQDVLVLFLKNKLYEWLLIKITEGCRITPHDSRGQGVIHLCAILDYSWAVRLFSLSGLSLDFRDAFGWTALHWAAYCGRENMVAALLSAGANPSLVTDPNPESPGGCTAADLASKGGYEGLAAYLAEKGLTAHFKAMSQSGNISAPSPQTSTHMIHSEYSQNLSEQEICLKESLAAYRNAADAADRIQAAFRERALKQQTRAVELANPIMEATQIVSALKIQHAFRNYNRRRLLKAAAQIQSHFRTWQARKDFINMRRQAIKIQAAFRGHQCRRQYRKLTWSVGVLEKAILRWRKKRKGLRGIQSEDAQEMKVDKEQEEDVAEEDFFRAGREQAEERVRNSVVKVQAMFRSYQAQQEYRRMKLAYEKAKLEFDMDGATENQ